VGTEASGHARWFERLLAELQLELWIGDAAKIDSLEIAMVCSRTPSNWLGVPLPVTGSLN